MAAEPFVIDIPQSALDGLSARLANARLPLDFANENSRMGIAREHMDKLVDYWRDGYDWRAQEAQINKFSHFRATIEGIPIHFIHVKGVGPSPKPLILSHGWPWTFWDYREAIGPLTDPAAHGGDAADAYDVIVPSLPGFAFSTPLTVPGINFWRTADIWDALMRDVLGYERYFAAGGDFGNLATTQLGHKYSGHVTAIHVTGAVPLGLFSRDLSSGGGQDWGFTRPQTPSANPHLREPVGRGPGHATAHVAVHTLEPLVLSYAMNDSPVGLLAWLMQRRFWWGDCEGDLENSFDKDFLITTAMIYWLTESFSSSVRYYAEAIDNPWQPSHDRTPVVDVPTGISFFDHDLISQSRFWVEDYYNLVFTNSHEKGGHFAVAEYPDKVVADIRETFRPYR